MPVAVTVPMASRNNRDAMVMWQVVMSFVVHSVMFGIEMKVLATFHFHIPGVFNVSDDSIFAMRTVMVVVRVIVALFAVPSMAFITVVITSMGKVMTIMVVIAVEDSMVFIAMKVAVVLTSVVKIMTIMAVIAVEDSMAFIAMKVAVVIIALEISMSIIVVTVVFIAVKVTVMTFTMEISMTFIVMAMFLVVTVIRVRYSVQWE